MIQLLPPGAVEIGSLQERVYLVSSCKWSKKRDVCLKLVISPGTKRVSRLDNKKP
jgi:hypothetical protein